MIDQVLPLVVAVALVGLAALQYRRRAGTAAATTATFTPGALAELGVRAGAVNFVLFTAPGCAPCGPAKRVLDEAGARHGVAVVVADVAEHHAVATAQHVYRAPTTFIVDEQGRALARISGVPRPEELDRVVAAAEAHAA